VSIAHSVEVFQDVLQLVRNELDGFGAVKTAPNPATRWLSASLQNRLPRPNRRVGILCGSQALLGTIW
jgi:hypothetical protein